MPIKKSVRTQSHDILKVEINDSWSAGDFANLFDSMNRLYAYTFAIIQGLDSLRAMGEELNWGNKYSKLPRFVDYSYRFKRVAMKILQTPDFGHHTVSYPLEVLEPISLPSVQRITYGSKGSVDLLGIGKIFEIIKDLVINYFPNDSQKLDQLLKTQEIEEREQKILQLRIENLRRLGLDSGEILTLIGFESYHVNKIKELLNSGRISGLRIEKLPGE